MKPVIILVWCSLFTGAPGARASFVAVGQSHACAWDGRRTERPICWGNNDHEQKSVPEIHSLLSLGAGAWHTCAIHETNKAAQVSCWGDSTFGQRRVKPHASAVALSVGRWHSCLLDEVTPGELTPHCWGRDDLGQSTISKKVSHPTAIFAGNNFTCARNRDGRIVCWGKVKAEFAPSEMDRVTGSTGFTCTTDPKKIVECWSNHPGGVNPFVYTGTEIHSCTLQKSEIQCVNKDGTYKVHAKGVVPATISVGENNGCALSFGGLECWGDPTQGVLSVPNDKLQFGPVLPDITQGAAFLTTLAEFLYSFDADFVSRLATQMGKQSSDEAQATLFYLAPYLNHLPYRHIRFHYTQRASEFINKSIHPHKGTPETALHFLAVALQTAKSLINREDRPQWDNALGAISKALGNDESLSKEAIESVDSLLNKYASNSFLYARIQSMMRALERLRA